MTDLEVYLVALLVKLGVVASIASTLARWATFKSLLMQESRTLNQRLAKLGQPGLVRYRQQRACDADAVHHDPLTTP